jgi:hypothetical protein
MAADARFGLARVFERSDPRRARELANEAAEFYASDAKHADDLERVQAWLDKKRGR